MTPAQHKMARATFELAISRYKRKTPSKAAMQYAQADALLETTYGLGWKGAMVGSHNWGAVQCTAGQAPCIAYQDSYPDGTTYSVSFRKYNDDIDGAQDVLRHVLDLRPRVAAALASRAPTVFDASYAMRREKYYGGFCPVAVKQYGAAVGKASFADPDRDAGTRACAREAIEAHAKTMWQHVQAIAAGVGEPLALTLGSYEEAERAWHGGGARRGWGAFAGIAPAGGSGAGLWALLRYKPAARVRYKGAGKRAA